MSSPGGTGTASQTPTSCCRADVQAETIRSGLAESIHRTDAVAVDRSGRTLLQWGEPDRTVFYRSAIKAFQATAGLEAGLSLPFESLAVACSSHSGSPAHIAHVRAILATVALDETALKTPPDWPLARRAARRLQRAGHLRTRRIFHNCSGKHAAWLAASRVAGHSVAAYLGYEHPLQAASRAIVGEATHMSPEPTGVDGCGAPTLRGSIRSLARGFASLTSSSRFELVATATSRYPSLVGGDTFGDGKIAAWWPGPVKGGAEGLLAAGRDGVGIAVKSEAGSRTIASMAMMEAMRRLGALSAAALEALTDIATPPVLGGGRIVGRIEPDVVE